jgi:aerobic carbon-monoxide dehydrogenase medium subunit
VKPSPFTYHRPDRVADAVSTLGDLGSAAKVLAGGQSLVPMMSMRIAAPEHLVDINWLSELSYVRSSPDGVRIGALARHARVERDADAVAVLPLLRQALVHVAHPTIRNRGTVVGSLAHADPSGELTAVLALTGGSVTVEGTSGRRDVAASEFFLGVMESAVRPGELAVEAFFPALPLGTGTAFVEIARRHGDYALCGVAAAAGPTGPARVAYISMSPVPVVLDVAAADGDRTRDDAWRAAADAAVENLEPEGDLHASADYRHHLARVLTRRALAAAARAAGRAA